MKKFFRNHKWQLTTLSLLAIIALLASMITFSPSAVIKKQWGNVITIGSEVSASTTADFTATGTAAQQTATFQTALNDLPSSGGILNILSGTFTFNATVTRAIANVTIEGIGMSTIFTNNASTPIFTAGGNGWNFEGFVTDAGGIATGATTGWLEINVTVGATLYTERSPNSSLVDNTFTGALNASIGRTDSITIVASNAPSIWKQQGDIVLTNTVSNEVAIENAAASLGSSGGNIYLSPGTFGIGTTGAAASLVITETNVTLIGASEGSVDSPYGTVLIANKTGMPDIQLGTNGAGTDSDQIQNIFCYGGGIKVYGGRTVINNVYVDYGTIELAQYGNNKLSNVEIDNATSNGLLIDSASTDNMFNNFEVQNTGNGINIQGSSQQFVNVHIWGCYNSAVDMETGGVDNIEFDNGYFEPGSNGFLIGSGSGTISGIKIDNSRFWNNSGYDLSIHNYGTGVTQGVYTPP